MARERTYAALAYEALAKALESQGLEKYVFLEEALRLHRLALEEGGIIERRGDRAAND
jgi:hypothetical protein